MFASGAWFEGIQGYGISFAKERSRTVNQHRSQHHILESLTYGRVGRSNNVHIFHMELVALRLWIRGRSP